MRFQTTAAIIASLVLAAGCTRISPEAGRETDKDKGATSAHTVLSPLPNPATEQDQSPRFASSASCRDCHKDFYKLWATSFHGLAMQPYTPEFGRKNLSSQTAEIVIGKMRYQAEIDDRGGRVRQRGPNGEKTFPIEHVMGGKNVYYFLTPLARGRLQVLPVAYDVHKKAWYDTAASGVRHFPDRRDEALAWTDRMYTFNTACFNCHVSRLRTNYDLATDSYNTTWGEQGINCESCHGPAGEHNRVMNRAADPSKVEDIKIIRANDLSTSQMNDLCAACHAKLQPLSTTFEPGQAFFDHFDLIVLDHPDYWPDGRDLGENYTYTLWLMSPCAKSGKLDCNHCHTPSGRMRFTGQQANQACAGCHQKYVDEPTAHGHHEPGSQGNDCLGCHMPKTRFAGMNRTDHSMLPPTPATTIAFKSPNACNLCHADQDAAWADTWVRQWYPRDYQAPVIERATLVDAARKGQWRRLPEMLKKVSDSKEDAVLKASLIRLLRGCPDESKVPALVAALHDPSPLVRASAAAALAERLNGETVRALLAATRDPSRLVRVRAAMALAPIPADALKNPEDRQSLKRAVEEFTAAMQARSDDWSGHANLGSFHMDQGDFRKALACFDDATRLEPRAIGPIVNASIAYSNLGQNDKAEASLRRALKVEPNNPAALFNLGLLLAEGGRVDEAETTLRAAIKADPKMAAAAYNLGVLCGNTKPDEAVAWCRRAYDLEPASAKYAYTLAFFLRNHGNVDQAIETLRGFIAREKSAQSAWDVLTLLGDLYESQGKKAEAAAVYRRALAVPGLPPEIRVQLEAKLKRGRSCSVENLEVRENLKR